MDALTNSTCWKIDECQCESVQAQPPLHRRLPQPTRPPDTFKKTCSQAKPIQNFDDTLITFFKVTRNQVMLENLAIQYFEEQRWDNVRKTMEALLDLNPENDAAKIYRAIACFEMQNRDRASLECRKLLRDNPSIKVELLRAYSDPKWQEFVHRFDSSNISSKRVKRSFLL